MDRNFTSTHRLRKWATTHQRFAIDDSQSIGCCYDLPSSNKTESWEGKIPKIGFFAYPDNPAYVGEVLRSAIDATDRKKIVLTPWAELNVTGIKLDGIIRDRINSSDILFADITHPNFNVYYEIGFAIGKLKTVVPCLNTSFGAANVNANLIGFFDTIGQCRYNNANELSNQIHKSLDVSEWISSSFKSRDFSHPLFVLDTLVKSDFRNWVFQAATNSKVNFRTFDPDENPRLTAYNCVGDVTASAGVIVPILHQEFQDAYKHNLRAALIAGIAHGLEKRTLIVQFEDKPAPLDYRDFIETVRTRLETHAAVERFCAEVLVDNQKSSSQPKHLIENPLSAIDIGRSAAENEEETLEQYFLETAEYIRIERSPSSIVIGRKGSGKSAIFTKMQRKKIRDKRCLLVDLKPASHNLSELRQEIIDVVNVGVFDHTITAFWEYILYMEIVHRYREQLLSRWKNSTKVFQSLAYIEKTLGIDEKSASGDFTSRLDHLIHSIIGEIRSNGRSGADKITNIVFQKQIPIVRGIVIDAVSDYDELVVIFDNIDKGWPATRLEENDIRIVRLLFEALHKIQRELARRSIKFQFVITLRNDVYDLLIEETPDRGKYNAVSVDWHDKEQLRNLILERLKWTVDSENLNDQWLRIFPVVKGIPDTFDYLVERSLYRPRFLIDLIERIISYSINRGYSTVREKDISDAIQDNSRYLVGYLGFEVRDVSGFDENIFFEFVGKGDILTREEISIIISSKISSDDIDEFFLILLWYGFIGIAISDTEKMYIYDYKYDFRKMMSVVGKSDNLYCVNTAFIDGLT